MPKLHFGKVKLTLIISFCLTVLILSPLFLTLTNSSVFAQIASGYIKILDIVMNKGGGTVKSGNITISNVSIGESIGGNFVASGNNTVCAGHACKKDYSYNPGRQPTLQQLIINAAQDSIAAGKYGISGLQANQEGGSYYNALSIQPQFSGVKEDIELTGAAFIENTGVTDVLGSAFNFLLTSADRSKGFVVVYANKNKNLSGGPRVGGSNRCGFNFCANNYYVYLDGKWNDKPFARNDPDWSTKNDPGFPQDRIIEASNYVRVIDTTNHNPPLKPAFKAYFRKELGSYTWGTYGFAVTLTDLAGSITNATPVPSSSTVTSNQLNASSVSSDSTLYLFSLF